MTADAPAAMRPPVMASGQPGSRWPAGALAKWLVAMFGLLVIINVISLFVGLHRASLADDFGDDPSITVDELENADNVVAAVGSFQLIVWLVIAVLFIIWLYRAAKRVKQTRPDALRYKPGWAIGGWFVPIWFLFRPKQMVDDIWRGTRDAREGIGVPAWIHIWWALWLISEFMARFLISSSSDAESLEDVASADRLAAATDAVELAAAVLAALLVAALSRRLSRLPEPSPGLAWGTIGWRFNPPPGWPTPPAGWTPPPGWQPDPSWPPPPVGWVLWLPDR